jgi:hypothetical protein
VRLRLPWTTRRELREEIAALEAQVERMDKINTSMKLLSAGAQPDNTFMLELQCELWPLIAQSLFAWFKEIGAENYIEQTMTAAPPSASLTFKAVDGIMPEVFTLTLQRLKGKSPHQLRREAERECANLRERVRQLEIAVGSGEVESNV